MSRPTLEGALARLEAIVAEIEGGQLELDEALARFEEGVSLVRLAGQTLDAAEMRVQQLLENGEDWELRPLPTGE